MPKGEKIGALWQKAMKDGQLYFKGKIDNHPVVVFPNQYKQGDNYPDFIIYEDLPMEGGGSRAGGVPPSPPQPPKQAPLADKTIHEEDEIPF